MATSAPRKKTPPTAVRPPTHDPAWEACAWLDMPWADRLHALAREADEAPGLDPRVMALVALAVDAAPQSLYPQGVRRHMRLAPTAGASLEELATLRHREPPQHNEDMPT